MRHIAEWILGFIARTWVIVFGTKKTVVLAYHSISDSPWTHAISPSAFREELKWLTRHAQVVTLEEAERSRSSVRQSRVAITFDDGYADWIEHAAPALRERNLPAMFFVTTSFQLVTSQPQEGLRPLRFEDVRRLADLGFEIGSHSATHVDLSSMTSEEARHEIQDSKKILEGLSGRSVTRFSYPKGRFRPELFPILRAAGYVTAYGGHGAVSAGMNNYLLPRVPMSGKPALWRFKGRVYRALVWG